ncbi:sensor histidine kinase [Salinispira pacifica]|uniref:histidine kinase n=1 Tax=Salinispira pacifica TaxID=1307761 RepID=V5WI53_9SPIO|nr:PAS domain-containing protein [Salinispira pacifica]AHC14851.1 multi-sensor hybrid histidine kinase [Salinispira pacifica]
MDNTQKEPLIIIVDSNQYPDTRIREALGEAGYSKQLVVHDVPSLEALFDKTSWDCPHCIFINIHADMLYDPFHPLRDLRIQFLMPAVVFGDDEGDWRHSAYFGGNLFTRLKPPYGKEDLQEIITRLQEGSPQDYSNPLSSNWLYAAINSVKDGVLIMDDEHRIIMGNIAAERLLKYNMKELHGEVLDSVLQLENIHDAEQRYRDSFLIEWGELIQKDGARVPVELHQKKLFDRYSRVPGYLVIIHNEFSKAQYAESLREAHQQQAFHSKARSEFISNMSHELRTPLNSILGMADLALELAKDSEQQEFLSILHRSTRNLSRLINTILDYSQLEARSLTLEYERFHLSRLLENTLRVHIDQAQGKNLRVYLDIQPGLRSVYRGDKARIAQIISNLFSNAVKFTSRGYILLKVYEREAPEATTLNDIRQPVELFFEVHDSGIGIDQNDQQKIFEPFYQVSSNSTRSYGGTGLGLALSMQLAQRMGGTVQIRSTPGQGSVFTTSVLVNREESGLLYLSPRSSSPSGMLSPVAGIGEIVSSRLNIVSEDLRWIQTIVQWLEFVGLKHRVINTLDEFRSIPRSSRLNEHFLYDGSLSWVSTLNRELEERSERPEGLQLVSRFRNSYGALEWKNTPLPLDWIFEPVQISELLSVLLNHGHSAGLQNAPGEMAAQAPSAYIIVSQTRNRHHFPGYVDALKSQIEHNGSRVQLTSSIEGLSDPDLLPADLIVAFDSSFQDAGIIDSGESGREFVHYDRSYQERNGLEIPVIVICNATANEDIMLRKEGEYRKLGFHPIKVRELSPATLLDGINAYWFGVQKYQNSDTEAGQSDLLEIIQAIRNLNREQLFEELESLSRNYQYHLNKSGEKLLANDVFRIGLAARRKDSEAVYNILNSMRLEIESPGAAGNGV